MLAPGIQGYVKLFALALRKLKPGGLFIACSCSRLVTEEAFGEALMKACEKSQIGIHWVAQSIQSADHPIPHAFPEARYLKCWIGIHKKI